MKHFTNILIGVLLVIIFLQKCGGNGSGTGVPGPDTVKVVDTQWVTKTKTVYKKVHMVKEETTHDTLIVPEPMYEPLKEQFEELRDGFVKRRIYKDTLVLDSIGHVYITDSVRYNKLEGRSLKYHYNLPVVKETTTITKYAAPKRQLYVGGGISANKTNVASVHAGLLYKDRKDRVFGGFVGFDPAGQMSVGVQSYWKITLKK